MKRDTRREGARGAARLPLVLALSGPFLAQGSGCGSTSPSGNGDGDADAARMCQVDTLDGPDSAGELSAGAVSEERGAEGFICPVGDQDWYALTVPEGHHLVRVSLDVTGPGSPIRPTYAIYGPPCTGSCLELSAEDRLAEGCCAARGAPSPEEVGAGLQVDHCLEPGDYFVAVRAQGDNTQDFRRPRGVYHLTVSTAPDVDPAEPNDGPDSAASLEAAGTRRWAARGQIACRGDQDWYVLQGVGENELLEVSLTLPIANFQPQFRIVGPGGAQIVALANPSGTVAPTELSGFYALPSGGRYYVVVEDDDGGQADPGVTYDLAVRTVADTDPNERNNSAGEATNLGALSCGGAWSTVSASGTLAATNDIDVYRVSLEPGCAGGVLEAEVQFRATPPEGLEPSVRLVRSHPETPCQEDRDCRKLLLTCDPANAGMDCAGFGNSCLDTSCAGATMCLPNRSCGANILERHPDRCGDDGQCRGPAGVRSSRSCSVSSDCAPQGRVSTAIPLGRNPDPTQVSALDQIFVVVSDFGADGYSPDLTYDLRVRARSDPDGHEPNDRYNPFLTSDHNASAEDLAASAEWGGCIDGWISFERDQDWFSLPHPCPGENCTLRISYDLGQGPVEFYATTRGAWDNLTRIVADQDEASNPARSGAIGGGGECVPAHSGLPERLYVVVRDLDLVRDFSAEQGYRICFEAPTPGCNLPCEIPQGSDQCYYPQ